MSEPCTSTLRTVVCQKAEGHDGSHYSERDSGGWGWGLPIDEKETR